MNGLSQLFHVGIILGLRDEVEGLNHSFLLVVG